MSTPEEREYGALMFGKDDKKYPREWCYDADGHLYSIITNCHGELHRTGIESFEARHGVDLESLAAETEKLWRAADGGEANISQETKT